MTSFWRWTKKKYLDIVSEIKRHLNDEGSEITEEVKQLGEELEKNGISGLRRKVQTDTERWRTIPLHFAVIGRTGVGKSSFINALLHLEQLGDGAAETGIKETTLKITAYKYPKNPNIVLHDLPGVGTKNFPKDDYLRLIQFNAYDFFFLLTKDRFSEDESWIATEIRKRGKQLYFVRTAIDETFFSEQKMYSRFKKSMLTKESLCEKVRKACAECLDDAKSLFLVESFDTESFDFPKMEEQLIDDLPDIKKEALILSLSAVTTRVLERKYVLLRRKIIRKALQITATKDECEQKRIFIEEVSSYQEQFGLDNITLRQNIDILSYTKENIEQFKLVFDDEMDHKEEGIFVETPTEQRRKQTVWARFKDFFSSKDEKLIYTFCVCGLTENLNILHSRALRLHCAGSSHIVAMDCLNS